MTDTTQRNLMVTGGSRGIGATIAKLAGRRGYNVCITYQNNAAKAEAVADEIRAMGRKALAVKADAGMEVELVAAFETMDAAIGRVTHLVNNASSTIRKCQIQDIDAKTLDDTFRVNVASYFICAREAIRRMSKLRGGNGGAIVNISSVAALRANPFDWVHYGASKGAVDTFTIGMGFEGVQHGIRCNAVRPGPIDTDMNTPDHFASLIASVPMGRVGQTGEVANAVLFLLSDEASYCTGSILNVSGGRF